MMELSSEKTNGAVNGPAALHHPFVYPTNLRVLGYAAGVASVLPPLPVLPPSSASSSSSSSSSSSAASIHILSPASPANSNNSHHHHPGSTEAPSPNSLMSLPPSGFSMLRNLLFSDSEKAAAAAAFLWSSGGGGGSSSTPHSLSPESHLHQQSIHSPHLDHQHNPPPLSHHQHPSSKSAGSTNGNNSNNNSINNNNSNNNPENNHNPNHNHDHGSPGSISPSQSPPSPASVSIIHSQQHHQQHLQQQQNHQPPQQNNSSNNNSNLNGNNPGGGSHHHASGNAQLMHWMSAVMAEHINHHAVDGVHYVWNGAVEGKLNSPESHHHNSIKSGLDPTSPNLPNLYGAPRSNNSGSSVSSSPPSSAGLIVPQPLSSGPGNGKSPSHHPSTNGTGRKYQCKMCPQGSLLVVGHIESAPTIDPTTTSSSSEVHTFICPSGYIDYKICATGKGCTVVCIPDSGFTTSTAAITTTESSKDPLNGTKIVGIMANSTFDTKAHSINFNINK